MSSYHQDRNLTPVKSTSLSNVRATKTASPETCSKPKLSHSESSPCRKLSKIPLIISNSQERKNRLLTDGKIFGGLRKYSTATNQCTMVKQRGAGNGDQINSNNQKISDAECNVDLVNYELMSPLGPRPERNNCLHICMDVQQSVTKTEIILNAQEKYIQPQRSVKSATCSSDVGKEVINTPLNVNEKCANTKCIGDDDNGIVCSSHTIMPCSIVSSEIGNTLKDMNERNSKFNAQEEQLALYAQSGDPAYTADLVVGKSVSSSTSDLFSLQEMSTPSTLASNVGKSKLRNYSSPLTDQADRVLASNSSLSNIHASLSTISADELFYTLQNENKTTLIIDIRDVKDFNDSHIMADNVINISQLMFPTGTCEVDLKKRLSDMNLTAWVQANKAGLVVLVQYSTTMQDISNHSVVIMLMLIREMIDPLTVKLCVLHGGYSKWQSLLQLMNETTNRTESRSGISVSSTKNCIHSDGGQLLIADGSKIHELLNNANVLFLDIRNPGSFSKSHLETSINLIMPVSKFAIGKDVLTNFPSQVIQKTQQSNQIVLLDASSRSNSVVSGHALYDLHTLLSYINSTAQMYMIDGGYSQLVSLTTINAGKNSSILGNILPIVEPLDAYDMIQSSNVLIIDIRQVEEFLDFHVKVQQTVSLPKQSIPSGVSFSELAGDQFDELLQLVRSFDKVILVDHKKAELHNIESGICEILTDICRLQSTDDASLARILILNGGIEKWRDQFPNEVTTRIGCRSIEKVWILVGNKLKPYSVEFSTTGGSSHDYTVDHCKTVENENSVMVYAQLPISNYRKSSDREDSSDSEVDFDVVAKKIRMPAQAQQDPNESDDSDSVTDIPMLTDEHFISPRVINDKCGSELDLKQQLATEDVQLTNSNSHNTQRRKQSSDSLHSTEINIPTLSDDSYHYIQVDHCKSQNEQKQVLFIASRAGITYDTSFNENKPMASLDSNNNKSLHANCNSDQQLDNPFIEDVRNKTSTLHGEKHIEFDPAIEDAYCTVSLSKSKPAGIPNGTNHFCCDSVPVTQEDKIEISVSSFPRHESTCNIKDGNKDTSNAIGKYDQSVTNNNLAYELITPALGMNLDKKVNKPCTLQIDTMDINMAAGTLHSKENLCTFNMYSADIDLLYKHKNIISNSGTLTFDQSIDKRDLVKEHIGDEQPTDNTNSYNLKLPHPAADLEIQHIREGFIHFGHSAGAAEIMNSGDQKEGNTVVPIIPVQKKSHRRTITLATETEKEKFEKQQILEEKQRKQAARNPRLKVTYGFRSPDPSDLEEIII